MELVQDAEMSRMFILLVGIGFALVLVRIFQVYESLRAPIIIICCWSVAYLLFWEFLMVKSAILLALFVMVSCLSLIVTTLIMYYE